MSPHPIPLMLTLLLASPTLSVADSTCAPTTPAAALAENGLRSYREGSALPEGPERVRALEQAVRCYQLARRSSRHGAAKLNHPLGLAYEKLGRRGAAYAAYEAFLREIPEAERLPGVTAQVNAKLASLRPRVHLLHLLAPADAELILDGQPAGRAPLDHWIALDPGPHLLLVKAPQQPAQSLPLHAVAGREEELRVSALAAAAPPPNHRRRAAYGTLAAGLLLVGAGATLWALADRPTCDAPGGPVGCPQRLPPPGYGIGLSAAGVATLGVSLTLFLLSRPAAQEPSRAQRTPTEGDTHSSGTAMRVLVRSAYGSP